MKVRKYMEITNEMITNYQEYLKDEERSMATVEKYMRDVRKFVGYLAGELLDKTQVKDYK